MKKSSQQRYASAAKARRQKQILAGLGVVLVVVLVIQVPKMLSGSSSAPSGTTPTASAPGTPQPGLSAAPRTATSASVATGARLAANESRVADASPPRTKSQVVSFDRFASKDPFVQQVTVPTTPTAGVAVPSPTGGVPATGAAVPSPSVSGLKPTATAPSKTGKTGAEGTRPPVLSSTSSSYASSQLRGVAAVPATPQAAVIAVNGQNETVSPGQAFPAANPTFKLVSITDGTALIGLAGGTFASGTTTVTLVPGHTLTLVDTTDGVRYELLLEALSPQ